MVVFGGSAHPALAAAICGQLGLDLAPSRVTRFANDCLEVGLGANCRERDVFLVQPLCPPTQEHLVELLLMIDAAHGASAARITAVIPHYAYARSDKKDAPRISIGGRLVADQIAAAGADRVLTMTLHSPQVHGFFSVPVDHLNALGELSVYFRDGDLSRTTVLSPDLGNAKEADRFARILGVPVAVAAKERIADDRVVISSIIGEVTGRDVIVLDDEIAGGSTMVELLDHLTELDVASVRLACTHGLFTGGALHRLAARDDVAEIVCTDTVPVEDDGVDKATVLSVAPALAEAMRRIHEGESVSAMFDAVP